MESISEETELETLSEEQRTQVLAQLERHEHTKYSTDIVLSENKVLEGFVVYPDVLRPESMTSLFLARHFYQNRDLYEGKTVVDMGCGSGIQGIVMAQFGAKKVVFADISSQAVENTLENIRHFGVAEKAIVVQGNLFENVENIADLIVFNHPFFPADSIQERPVSISMLDKGDLIHEFFRQAKTQLSRNGVIVMPYFHSAGDINDPEIQAPKHNLDVQVALRKKVDTGIQKGLISIYQIRVN